MTLHTLVAGDFAGELSFIDDTERYASPSADGPTRVMSLRRPQLESLLKTGSGDRLSRDARDRAHRTRDPAPAVEPVGGTRELHLQAARSLLNVRDRQRP